VKPRATNFRRRNHRSGRRQRRGLPQAGVGPVVALTFRATVDVPSRFTSSKAVGAAFGLRPRAGPPEGGQLTDGARRLVRRGSAGRLVRAGDPATIHDSDRSQRRRADRAVRIPGPAYDETPGQPGLEQVDASYFAVGTTLFGYGPFHPTIPADCARHSSGPLAPWASTAFSDRL
jgi:hypothetical protein